MYPVACRPGYTTTTINSAAIPVEVPLKAATLATVSIQPVHLLCPASVCSLFPELVGRRRPEECSAVLPYCIPFHTGTGPTALHWPIVVCAAHMEKSGEPLPSAPARHGRPFLCEPLMATRWWLNTQDIARDLSYSGFYALLPYSFVEI